MTSKKVQHLFAASAAALLMAFGAVGLSAGFRAETAATASAIASPTEAPAMSIVPALTPASPEPPANNVTSVRFRMLQTCGDSTTYQLKVGNTIVGTTTGAGGSCTCGPPQFVDVTLTDANTLAAANADACMTYSVTQVGGSYVSWARADVTRQSGGETNCIIDRTGRNCAVLETNLCFNNTHVHTVNATFTSAFPNTDGDADPNCTDLDDDNDGVADDVDNCPLTSNPGQEDVDGDGIGNACQIAVVAVPWAGSEARPHVVFSGGKLVLQAAMFAPKGMSVALTGGTWDPGDGAGPQSINVSNPRVLEYTHTYSGADSQPYTATISVTDGTKTYTDTFKVQIVARTLDAEANMAIDKGLWYEHKQQNQTDGSWNSDHPVASTASTVQAFEVNGHRESGDPAKDPYVTTVEKGLRYLETELRRVGISAQPAGNPDSNGNGIGVDLRVYRSHEPVYVLGQVMDAFVASGTPNALVQSGSEAGRTYKDIVQDMIDMYSYGQNEPGSWGEPEGGWVYFWNANDGIDSSSSAWWGVGVHAARVWGLDAPQWVIQKNANNGIPALQQAITRDPSDYYHGSCAYRAGNGGSPTQTAACMIMMSVDGFERDSARYAGAEAFLRRNFNYGEMHGNMYAMYNLAKAMRLANDNDGNPAPITLLGGDLDWYNKDLGVSSGTHGENGFARYLVSAQQPDGRWDSQGWVSGTTSTAWGILILSPALFEVGPTAACSVDSNIVCKAGTVGGCNPTGTNPYATVNFDGSQSTAGDNPIASYTWDFTDGGSATGDSANHQFSSVGTFNVKLTVADTKGIKSSVTCPVQVVETALPPVADPGGPYAVCPTGKIVLDGSASYGRGANIISYEWDWSAPINFATADFNGATPGDQTSVFTSQGPGTYDVALRVKDDSATGFVTTKFTTVTIKSPNDPDCAVKDQDGDGIDDPADNCVATPNSDQTDTDGDGQGDACDPDDDNDGVEDGGDNCSLTANSDQANNDGDAQGDVCDPDDDNDGVDDGSDNCALTANSDQLDTDNDGQGNACDPDDDNDGVEDGGDNCSLTANADQADNDGDGQGDACDPDDDNDGFPDGGDACQFIAGVASAQGCPDADGDTVQDATDNCPTTPNTNQANNDGDAQGDACDPDDDNDTLPDDIDPRPFNPNEAPSCSAAGPSIAQIWPPNHQLVPVSLVGATDVDGDVLTIVVTSIFQDEPTNTQGDGNTAIDGYGVGTNTAQVRAERSGTPRVPGDGRVYHITFKVSDALTSCTKTVTVGVPHDQGQRRIPVDQGPLFKSTGGQ